MRYLCWAMAIAMSGALSAAADDELPIPTHSVTVTSAYDYGNYDYYDVGGPSPTLAALPEKSAEPAAVPAPPPAGCRALLRRDTETKAKTAIPAKLRFVPPSSRRPVWMLAVGLQRLLPAGLLRRRCSPLFRLLLVPTTAISASMAGPTAASWATRASPANHLQRAGHISRS